MTSTKRSILGLNKKFVTKKQGIIQYPQIAAKMKIVQHCTNFPPNMSSTTPVVPLRHLGNLNNPIHRIFTKSNFQNVNQDEYNALSPTLRLATRLITTREIAGFPHAILVAPLGFTNGKQFFFRKRPALTQQDMVIYNEALETLADMVKFQAVSHEPVGHGCCNPDVKAPPPQHSRLLTSSVIDISKDDILSAVETRANCSELASQKQSLMFAKILCHELIHAMALARLGRAVCVPNIVPFGNQTVVENGYEWEDYVFGGLICGHRPKHLPNTVPDDFDATDLRHIAWPSASITRTYVANKWPIMIVKEPSTSEVHWQIDPTTDPTKSYTWIPSLSSTRFWDHVVPNQGAIAVKAPKIRGIRHVVNGEGKAVEINNPFILGAHTIPDGYRQDPNDGAVVL